MIDLLYNTGCQCGSFGLEYRVYIIFLNLYEIAGQSAQEICKYITASLT